ncbi:MAG: RNA methyltransferase [Bacilli bacterium]|nr:RNA methyltransferase [Bacilli bacterium]
MIITSLENKKVKDVVKLQSKKYRDLTNAFVVETEHLVEEANKCGIVKELFLVEDEFVDSDDVNYVTPEIMKKMSSMESPSNILAVCEKSNSKEIIGNKILLLDEIQDPGNLGTIIRSSVAFGVTTIILSPDTVDLYNPKVIRASEGMFCHINIITMDLEEAISIIKSKDINVYGTNVVNGIDVRNINDNNSYALVMGNEGNGVKQNIQELCDKNLYIPMNNNCESLNVGVACSILLYELGE